MLSLKKIIKYILPLYIINFIKSLDINYKLGKYKNLTNKEIFSKIYSSQTWNNKSSFDGKKYTSGPGTQNINFVEQYVQNLSIFFDSFSTKPTIADIGCGDFEVGSKLVNYSSKYFAIDIFEKLINFNKKKFLNLNVNFLVLDITIDELPFADVYILRQVLQHLSNESISNFLKNIDNKCKYLIITEHLPDEDIDNFEPNIDILTGPYIRLHKNSGVDLTKKPFNLNVKNKKRLFISRDQNMEGVLDTTLLQVK